MCLHACAGAWTSCCALHDDRDHLKRPHVSPCSLGFDSLHIPSRSRCSICMLRCASVRSYVLYIPSRRSSVFVCWRDAKSGTRCLGFLNRWPFQHTRLSARTHASPETHTHTHTQNYDCRLHARQLLPDQLHNVSFLRQQTHIEMEMCGGTWR